MLTLAWRKRAWGHWTSPLVRWFETSRAHRRRYAFRWRWQALRVICWAGRPIYAAKPAPGQCQRNLPLSVRVRLRNIADMSSNPFRYFKTSPEIIRLAVMLYVRFPLSAPARDVCSHQRQDPLPLARCRPRGRNPRSLCHQAPQSQGSVEISARQQRLVPSSPASSFPSVWDMGLARRRADRI